MLKKSSTKINLLNIYSRLKCLCVIGTINVKKQTKSLLNKNIKLKMTR